MELPEEVKTINQRLIDHYGLFENGQPRYRVVWSDDEIEKRLTNFTAEGFELPYSIVREVPKYRQYIQHKFVLEGLVGVPEYQQEEALNKISYEPLWVFQDANNNPLPPKWQVIELVMRTLEGQMEHHAPYKGGLEEDMTIEGMQEKERIMSEALFGNESDIGDALSHGDGVGYTGNPNKVTINQETL